MALACYGIGQTLRPLGAESVQPMGHAGHVRACPSREFHPPKKQWPNGVGGCRLRPRRQLLWEQGLAVFGALVQPLVQRAPTAITSYGWSVG